MVEAPSERLPHLGYEMCGLPRYQRPATRKYIVEKRALYCAFQGINGRFGRTIGTSERGL